MTPDTLRAALDIRPFRPFVLHVRGGWKYPVVDPDLVQISTTTLTILESGPDNATSLIAEVALDAISSLTLAAPTTETP